MRASKPQLPSQTEQQSAPGVGQQHSTGADGEPHLLRVDDIRHARLQFWPSPPFASCSIPLGCVTPGRRHAAAQLRLLRLGLPCAWSSGHHLRMSH